MPDHIKTAENIYIETISGFFVAHFFQRTNLTESCIVYYHINSAEVTDCFINYFFDVLVAGDIHFYRKKSVGDIPYLFDK